MSPVLGRKGGRRGSKAVNLQSLLLFINFTDYFVSFKSCRTPHVYLRLIVRCVHMLRYIMGMLLTAEHN